MIYVIGGTNIDIYARSKKEIVYRDSNIGDINLTYGGVANNIAINLKALGENAKFITAFGGDYFSLLLKDNLDYEGIDYSLSETFDDENSSVYLAVLDNQNDMSVGINDMKVIDRLNKEKLMKLKDLINDDDFVVLDSNLSSEALGFIFNELRGKKIVEAISVNKVSKILPYLNKIDLIKLNNLEASSICGMKLDEKAKMIAFMKLMKKEGVKETLVSSREGLYIGSQIGVEFYKHNFNYVSVVNSSGAGDALYSAYIYGKYHGSDNKACATLGLVSAIITLGDDLPSGVINKTKIRETLGEANITGGFIYEY